MRLSTPEGGKVDHQGYNRVMMTPSEIKTLLKDWILRVKPVGNRDIFIDELCFIDKSRRADLVHANGKLSAFEIKSKADTLGRWVGQQDAYLNCFDEVWLCCHSKHLVKALSLTSTKVGLIVVDDLSGMAVIRYPKENGDIDAYHLTGFLWRDQLESLAQEYGKTFSRKILIKDLRHIVASLPLSVLRERVLNELKLRYTNVI